MTPEGKIKKEIRDYLKTIKMYNFLVLTTGIPDGNGGFRCNPSRGVSDIIGILPINGVGAIVCIEVKSAKGKLSPHQELFKHNVLAAKGFYIEARSLSDVKQGLLEIKKKILTF